MIWFFLILWAAGFGAALLLIAMTPATVVTPNAALLWPLVTTGVVAGLATLIVRGALSLFGV